MVDLEGVTLLANGLLCALMAGAMGGVANFLIAPLFGAMHLTTVCGVDIAPHLDKLDLYSKVFWGGVRGLVFLEPFLKRCVRSVWLRALVYGLLPSLVQMFLVFPLATPYGIGGVGLGAATPVFVLVFNTLGWSLPACAWFVLTGMGGVGDDGYSYEGTWTNPLHG